MVTKYITMPFDMERAKRITSGDEPGKIFRRDGKEIRIICFDAKNDQYPIVALLKETETEFPVTFSKNGIFRPEEEKSEYDLILSVPDWTQYKDGDILLTRLGSPFIYNGSISKEGDYGAYCGIDICGNLVFDRSEWTSRVQGYANDDQKMIIKEYLKRDSRPKAKEYLKKFYGIGVKKVYKLNPKDWVLRRESCDDNWKLDIFSHAQWEDSEECYHYYCVGGWDYECIPYEGNEKLLGTKMGLEDLK